MTGKNLLDTGESRARIHKKYTDVCLTPPSLFEVQ